MTSFVAVPHRPEIAVNYNPDDNQVVITLDECPSITDPQAGLYQEITIDAKDIPELIDALSKAYQLSRSDKS